VLTLDPVPAAAGRKRRHLALLPGRLPDRSSEVEMKMLIDRWNQACRTDVMRVADSSRSFERRLRSLRWFGLVVFAALAAALIGGWS
jgi:hypothetical protein